MRKIDKIIIHCTATREGQAVSVADVSRWHKERGFNSIGYHYLLGLNGEVWEGRQLDVIGAHTTGYNAESIGICYVGGLDAKGKPKDTRTIKQKEALITLIKKLKSKIKNEITVHGHYNFNANKECPCFDAYGEYKYLKI